MPGEWSAMIHPVGQASVPQAGQEERGEFLDYAVNGLFDPF